MSLDGVNHLKVSYSVFNLITLNNIIFYFNHLDTEHARVLKEIRVPLWSNQNCETALKKYFGKDYKLSKSNICAGRQGKDACDVCL